MFSLASGIYQSYFAPPKLSILIIGIDGAGKTSLLERIKVTDIQTKIEVDASGAPSPALSSSYAKGAVAGVGNNIAAGTNGAGHEVRQGQRRGQPVEGGKPARLPPPLPPKQAVKSSQWVKKAVEGGFSDDAESHASADPVDFLESVPPPPLVSTGNSGISMGSISDEGSSRKAARPPLPPRRDTPNNLTSTPVIETPTKQNSFIQLLRCPSPGKYSSAALGEEDDEYNENPAGGRDALEPWSTEYLKDYYIDYKEGEEFDVKQPRGGNGKAKKMFPLDRIRPTLGQNLAKLDLCGCKCSLFDLSGAEKMRPLWDRYYRDTDAVIYVVNAADTSFTGLLQSRLAFEDMCQHDTLRRRVLCGLPVLIFANQLDVAYREYDASLELAKNERDGRTISWNAEEEDDFVGGSPLQQIAMDEGGAVVSKRAVDFHGLATLFGLLPTSASSGDKSGIASSGNVFMFGGSVKSGEGVRAAMEHLVARSKTYHLQRLARK
ncbi:hypothetical protein ACHAXT_006222 [Thalassiosira profunda]